MSERRMSRENAERLLARAIELDADGSLTTTQLREIARDVGVSPEAMDTALNESPGPAAATSHVGVWRQLLARLRTEDLDAHANTGPLPRSMWRDVVTNGIAIGSGAAFSIWLMRFGQGLVLDSGITQVLTAVGIALGAGVAVKLRARTATLVLLGLSIAIAVEGVMDWIYGGPTIRGAVPHWALMIAAIAGVATGAILNSRSGDSTVKALNADSREGVDSERPSSRSKLLRIRLASALRRVAVAGGLALMLTPSDAAATWSVVAVDMATGRIVIASATCVNRDDAFLRGVQAVIVPGKGIAACQAAVDGTHANQMLVFNELAKGTEPAKIIEMLSVDPAFQSRQFGIVDLQGRSAGHSGLGNGYVTQDIQGRVPGTQIYYSIQGNILRPGEVVPRAVQAFLETNGALTDRVMAAMDAADAAGGDSRCTCTQPQNLPPAAAAAASGIPCEGRTSYIAYITMAERNDTNGDSHNNGKYAMYITVAQPHQAGANAIRAGENLNPVKTLRMRYDEWRRTQPASFR